MNEIDVTVNNHGSLFTLTPNTEAAEEWFAEHLPEDAMRWAGAVVVEPRYVEAIVTGMVADGLTVN